MKWCAVASQDRGVGPFCTDAATKAEKEFANAEASKGALVLRRPSRGLTELLRHLAESRSNGRLPREIGGLAEDDPYGYEGLGKRR